MTNDKCTVAVVGLGYIGLPTAAIIARSGCEVTGVDTSEAVVETINRGDIHIEEVDLDGLVQAETIQGDVGRIFENGAIKYFQVDLEVLGCEQGWFQSVCFFIDTIDYRIQYLGGMCLKG